MSDYYYRLVVIKEEHRQIFEELFQTQDPAECFNYKGGVNEFVNGWSEELYQKYETQGNDNPIVSFVKDNTVEFEYFTLYGGSWSCYDPSEYEWWTEIKDWFGKDLKPINKELKDKLKDLLTYENKGKTDATDDWYLKKIYEFIIDNWGGYCYHYVY